MTKKHSKIESLFADMMAEPHPAKVPEEVSQGLLYRINKEGYNS